MRDKILLLIAALGLLALVAEFAKGQTVLRPAQIQNWSQVAPPGSSRVGTRPHLEQLAIDPTWIAYWIQTIRTGGYDHFRMAVVPDQPNPILIVCLRPETDPLGPGCVGGVPWFDAIRIP